MVEASFLVAYGAAASGYSVMRRHMPQETETPTALLSKPKSLHSTFPYFYLFVIILKTMIGRSE
jgi:hypothetical protein